MELQVILLLLFASTIAVLGKKAAIEKCPPEKLKDIMKDLPASRISIHPDGDVARLYRGEGGVRVPKVDGEYAYIELDLKDRKYNLIQVGIDGNMQTIDVEVKAKAKDKKWRTPRYEADDWIAQVDFYDNGQKAEILRIEPGDTYDPSATEYRGTLRVMVCEK